MEIPVLSSAQLVSEVKKLLEHTTSVPDVVFFDFFDTLVTRTVPPEQTKLIAACQLADLLNQNVSGQLVYDIRGLLEKKLCDQNVGKGKNPEFNLFDLAEALRLTLEDVIGPDFQEFEPLFVQNFVDIELAVEKNVQKLKQEIAGLLQDCHRAGVKTAIISDFYIPSKLFEQLLIFHQLREFVDFVFVSADHLLTKGHSGRLYDIALEAMGGSEAKKLSSLVMIGDNHHADGTMAHQKGLTSFCLKPEDDKTNEGINLKRPGIQIVEQLFEQALEENRSAVFPEFGLSIFWFIHHLFRQAYQDKQRALFFCSKEGELLLKLFKLYQNIRFGRQVIRGHYLIVSRKSTFICSLRTLKEEDFLRLFQFYRDISPVEFLLSLNFSETKADDICRRLELEPEKRYRNFQEHEVFQTLVESSYFTAYYEEHRQVQKRGLARYLESFEVDFHQYGLAMVDVGWKGSIQNNIFYSLGGEIPLTGYYIGTLSPTETRQDNRKRGILFCDVPVHSPYIHVFNNNRSLFEMLLGASHGSADGYYDRNQSIAAERTGAHHFNNLDGLNGHPAVMVKDHPEERVLFGEKIAPLQETICQLFSELTKMVATGRSSVPSFEWFARKHARMVFMPTSAEIDFFTSLYHLENFGVFEFTDFDSNGRVSWVQKIKNLRRLQKDPAAYLETGVWPPIILRRMGLDFLTPLDGKRRHRRIFNSSQRDV